MNWEGARALCDLRISKVVLFGGREFVVPLSKGWGFVQCTTKCPGSLTKVTGGWRKFHKEELHNLCSWNIISVIKTRGIRLTDSGREGKCVRAFRRRTQREETIGRPRHRWGNNIKIDCKAKWRYGVDWILLDRVQWRANASQPRTVVQ
jgi:hypothetical protein